MAFVREGLARRERCLYIASEVEQRTFLAELEAAGVPTAPELVRGALLLKTQAETYLRSGSFDPDDSLAMMEGFTDQALADGFVGLRATAEASSRALDDLWPLVNAPRYEEAVQRAARAPALPGPVPLSRGRPRARTAARRAAHTPRGAGARRVLPQPVLRARRGGAGRRRSRPPRLAAAPAALLSARSAAPRGRHAGRARIARERRARAGSLPHGARRGARRSALRAQARGARARRRPRRGRPPVDRLPRPRSATCGACPTAVEGQGPREGRGKAADPEDKELGGKPPRRGEAPRTRRILTSWPVPGTFDRFDIERLVPAQGRAWPRSTTRKSIAPDRASPWRSRSPPRAHGRADGALRAGGPS